MKYDPAIHSPIFGPDEKPVNVGWYKACSDEGCLRSTETSELQNDAHSFQWVGSEWLGLFGGDAPQNLYWFGLREKPEEVNHA